MAVLLRHGTRLEIGTNDDALEFEEAVALAREQQRHQHQQQHGQRAFAVPPAHGSMKLGGVGLTPGGSTVGTTATSLPTGFSSGTQPHEMRPGSVTPPPVPPQ